MEVIQPVALTPEEAARENAVDTTGEHCVLEATVGFADVVSLLVSNNQH